MMRVRFLSLPRQGDQRMRPLYVLTVLIIWLTPAVGASAQSQITTAVIDGTVVDTSGAVLPGVDVEIRNVDTNLTRTMTTDRNGRFVALQLPPGTYTVTLKLSGFATVVQQDVLASVGDTVRLNPAMKVSGVAETVTVTTTSPAVETTRTTAASTLNERTIESTPILGRKFEDLLTLTPGVSVVQGPDGDEITFSGQRGVFNNVSLDGGDYTNGFFGEQVGGQRAAIDITLEAVKEFQVIATGASPEFGHTAGGVVNVITKSGTNQVSGSVFHYQRLEGLTSHTSDGKPLKDFHREQFGGTIGGPVVKDKAFYFLALEGVRENLQRPNLSEPIGTPCPVAAPTLLANEALIGVNGDCQRLALLGFFQSRRNQNEGLPIDHTINNSATLAKVDWNLTAANQLSGSYNFDYSKNTNQTFDVPTYGNSANGIEGPSKINVLNVNLFTTLTSTRLNEFHVTYSRENRPRASVSSSVPADTAMGFVPSFRFGHPFFLQPTVDELVKRFQVRNNISLVSGAHTIKAGGEWQHTNNAQVFRGFFEGRYIFDSVAGFLRYASPAAPGGFGPFTVGCSNGTYVTAPASCSAGSRTTGGPLLLYLQSSSPDGVARDAAGASDINNEEFALFVQDKSRADAELRPPLGQPAHAEDRRSEDDRVRPVPGRSAVPVGRDHPRSMEGVSAARRRRVGCQPERQDGRSRERGRLLRTAEHAEPGRVRDDERDSAEGRFSRQHVHQLRGHAGVAEPAGAECCSSGHVSALYRHPRVRSRLPQSSRVHRQRRVRSGSGAEHGGLLRLHDRQGHAPDAV